MRNPLSPLASQVDKPRNVLGERDQAHCIIVHTTGRGIVDQAAKHGVDPLEHAIAYYLTPNVGFAHYLVGWAGEIVQIASEAEPAWQAGWKSWERAAYFDGSWRTKWASDYENRVVGVNENHYGWWTTRWRSTSPQHITKDIVPYGAEHTPNSVGIGIECLWHVGGLTDTQYTALARLCVDVSKRRQFPLYAPPCARMLGHEDLCPCRRTDKKGRPWDPGSQLNWNRLWARILSITPMRRPR